MDRGKEGGRELGRKAIRESEGEEIMRLQTKLNAISMLY